MSDLLFKLFQQVYSPFKPYSSVYTNLLASHLQHELLANIKMAHYDTIECVQLLNTSVAKVFNLVDNEIDRCFSMTNGCGFAMLVDALKVFDIGLTIG